MRWYKYTVRYAQNNKIIAIRGDTSIQYGYITKQYAVIQVRYSMHKTIRGYTRKVRYAQNNTCAPTWEARLESFSSALWWSMPPHAGVLIPWLLYRHPILPPCVFVRKGSAKAVGHLSQSLESIIRHRGAAGAGGEVLRLCLDCIVLQVYTWMHIHTYIMHTNGLTSSSL
jgi:hypothetical protein